LSENINDQLVLIAGTSGTGKSASLMNIENPEGVIYCGTEAGKRLPFKSKFKRLTITDPHQVLQAFDQAETMDDVHTIVIDSLTFLMDMYESMYVLPSTNTMKAWGDYAQFFKTMMQQKVAASTKTVIFTGHNKEELDEDKGVMVQQVPIKGALKGNGLESFFSCIVYTRVMPIAKLKDYENEMLTITEEEEMLGFKHVFQTRKSKDMANSRIRGPMGLFSVKETFIDNDAEKLMKHVKEYYAE
tara:strand:- start:2045 stop:2776 length:732 start_codon:yes stop_codon:yes gene_type:complete